MSDNQEYFNLIAAHAKLIGMKYGDNTDASKLAMLAARPKKDA